MYIQMNKRFYHTLLVYSLSKLPEEACGFIVGTMQSSNLTASTFVPITNIAHNLNESFVMDPIEVMHTLNSQTKQSQIVGIFHTHPLAEAQMSHEDLQTLWHTVPSHWILSLLQPAAPVLHIYQVRKTPIGVIRGSATAFTRGFLSPMGKLSFGNRKLVLYNAKKKDHPVSYHKLPFVID